MNRRLKKKIYHTAINKWGVGLQLGMLMEECAELIQATHKVMRKGEVEQWEQLAEEMADVEIMIEQLKLTINWQSLEEKTESYKEAKLLRLKELVDI